jgi:hypothetical protein
MNWSSVVDPDLGYVDPDPRELKIPKISRK